jgi:hypothetical protein
MSADRPASGHAAPADPADLIDPIAAFEQLPLAQRRVLWRSVVQLEPIEIVARQEGLELDEARGAVRAAVVALRRTHLDLRDRRG